jgi:nitrate reductase NapE component
MTIIGLIVVLVIVGVLLYLLNTVIPMDAKIKTIINVIVVLAVCLWLLEAFGLVGPYTLGSGGTVRFR